MTSAEFRDWATSAAADWGYRVDISGVGISSSPSYYPSNHVTPGAPIYASNVAIFHLGSGIPARSPRSVRSTELPWLSKESNHPHKLVGRFEHPATMPNAGKWKGVQDVRGTVRTVMRQWNVPEVSLAELWGDKNVSGAAGGSKRYLVGALGGYGDVAPAKEEQVTNGESTDEFEVMEKGEQGVFVRWKRFEQGQTPSSGETWGEVPTREPPSAATGGW